MGRGTGRAEIVKAAEESIGYQIGEMRADGGPTRDKYLMQFQSDILNIPVAVPEREELSGIGAAYCAGIAAGVYPADIYARAERTVYSPAKGEDWRGKRLSGWKNAVNLLLK